MAPVLRHDTSWLGQLADDQGAEAEDEARDEDDDDGAEDDGTDEDEAVTGAFVRTVISLDNDAPLL